MEKFLYQCHQVNWDSSIYEDFNIIFCCCFFFCPLPHIMRDTLFPDQGSNTCSLQWKHRVLTSGPPGKSQDFNIILKEQDFCHTRKVKAYVQGGINVLFFLNECYRGWKDNEVTIQWFHQYSLWCYLFYKTLANHYVFFFYLIQLFQ